jgi:hypothetical protein
VLPAVCPKGYYCPTGISAPEPCTAGTYGNATGLRKVEYCQPCDPGSYCDGTGLTAPRGLCSPGFYCLSGCNTSTPGGFGNLSVANAIGDVCPAGYYCPLGSKVPSACPPGTFNSITGGSSSSYCVSCTPGSYCEGSGNTKVTGKCLSGYYCSGSATSPTQFQALPGYFAAAGSSAASPCPVGSYNNLYGQANCTSCPEGYYCPNQNMTTFSLCPAGNYCPLASSVSTGCPVGTFSANLGNKKLSDCTSCTPGYYCASSGTYCTAIRYSSLMHV